MSRGKCVSSFPIGAMGTFKVSAARTPCSIRSFASERESRQARQQSSHRGDGIFSRSLQHAHTVVDRSVRSCASVSRVKHVSHFPIGAMGTFKVSAVRTPCSRRSVVAAVAQARIKASASAIFPSGRWELSRSLQHALPVVDQNVSRSCASVSQGKHVSIFPSGRWEVLSVSTHITSCIACDGAR